MEVPAAVGHGDVGVNKLHAEKRINALKRGFMCVVLGKLANTLKSSYLCTFIMSQPFTIIIFNVRVSSGVRRHACPVRLDATRARCVLANWAEETTSEGRFDRKGDT